MKMYRTLGVVLILVGSAINPWTIPFFEPPNRNIQLTPPALNLIFTLLFVLCGLAVFRNGKTAVIRIALVVVSLLVSLGVLEGVLRSGYFDNLDDPRPIWIPAHIRKIGFATDHLKDSVVAKNEFGFNDINHPREKPTGKRRIAVLGDSFIWGSGVLAEQIWSRKLAALAKPKFPDVEFLHWGIGGWSTKREFEFLREKGIDFNLDLLIFAFMDNDPDMGGDPIKYLAWQHSFLLRPLRLCVPNSVDFFSAYLNTILEKTFCKTYGYRSWVQRNYSPENLSRYGNLLRDIANFCRQNNLPVLFVLTPQSTRVEVQQHFAAVVPLLERAHLEYLDLYPHVKTTFGFANPRTLWATPADYHPGKLLTSLYAAETLRVLEKRLLSVRRSLP